MFPAGKMRPDPLFKCREMRYTGEEIYPDTEDER